jgi:hypothetical protein
MFSVRDIARWSWSNLIIIITNNSLAIIKTRITLAHVKNPPDLKTRFTNNTVKFYYINSN